MTILKKSDYVKGLTCFRYLYKSLHEMQSLPKLTIVDEFRIKQGKEVEILAKKAYGSALEIPMYPIDRNLEQTAIALKQRKTILEPGFLHDSTYARIDILVPVGNSWDIIEIKSNSRVKPVHIRELAFQKYCVSGTRNVRIARYCVRHLNPDYTRTGELDLEQLFLETDVTEQVNEIYDEVVEEIATMHLAIASKTSPEVGKEPLCVPTKCPIKEYCWDFLPPNNVFELYYVRGKSFRLFKDGVYAIKDIPARVKLTRRQAIQKLCADSGEPHIAKIKLKSFLDTIKYPIYFLDFETINSAVPMFDATKPYLQIPFQFSLHILYSPDTIPEHYEYLYEGTNDPRPEFLEELQKVLGDSGSIVVYYEQFEIARLKELAKVFPEYQTWVTSVLSRIADLIYPFKKFDYYNEKQRGSASLKRVLPALTKLSYSNLEITEGLIASVVFFNLTYNPSPGTEVDKSKIRKQLLEYCKLDTQAELEIFYALTEIVQVANK